MRIWKMMSGCLTGVLGFKCVNMMLIPETCILDGFHTFTYKYDN